MDCVRILANSETVEEEPTPTWAGCLAQVVNFDPSVMQVGFLPFFPYPVTDDATVYTALKNFLNVLSQLKQKCLPVICDEGVFRILAQIVLQRPIEFQNILPMLGCFHLTKAVEHCLGKLLKGSGIEDLLAATNCFGIKIMEQVLGGTQYVRSLRGFMIIYESLRILQWEAFLKVTDTSNYSSITNNISRLNKCLKFKDGDASKAMFTELVDIISPLKAEFEQFCVHSEETSELCRYWNLVCKNIQYLKDLVYADCCGDWEGHLEAVQNVLPIFAECDSVNNLHYGSLYLEIMRRLPETHPDIYREFMQGGFVVKTNAGKFNAVAPDMKLEQTIQRSQKSTGDIVGETCQLRYVTEWEIIYHEETAISNSFRDIIKANVDNREYDFHHELLGSYSTVFNENIRKVVKYIGAKGNPFVAVGLVKLHNFITSATVEDTVKEWFLNFNDNSLARYSQFRSAVYIDKDRKLSDTIKRANLPSFNSHQQCQTQKPAKTKENDEVLKEFAKLQKDFDIARSRNIPISDILEYDLMECSYLFEGDYPTKTDKYVLVSELIQNIENNDMVFNKDSELSTALVIDFKSMIQCKSLASFDKINDLFDSVWKIVISTCTFQQLQVVYDSYVESSIKECERKRRSTCQPLEYLNLQLCSDVPTQADRFWASTSNKEKLQQLSRQYLAQTAQSSGTDLILSGVLMNDGTLKDCIRIKVGITSDIPSLVSSLEEADARIVPNVKYAIDDGYDRIAIISNDTDVVVLVLYFMEHP